MRSCEAPVHQLLKLSARQSLEDCLCGAGFSYLILKLVSAHALCAVPGSDDLRNTVFDLSNDNSFLLRCIV